MPTVVRVDRASVFFTLAYDICFREWNPILSDNWWGHLRWIYIVNKGHYQNVVHLFATKSTGSPLKLGKTKKTQKTLKTKAEKKVPTAVRTSMDPWENENKREPRELLIGSCGQVRQATLPSAKDDQLPSFCCIRVRQSVMSHLGDTLNGYTLVRDRKCSNRKAPWLCFSMVLSVCSVQSHYDSKWQHIAESPF